jgi:hypothetical protein
MMTATTAAKAEPRAKARTRAKAENKKATITGTTNMPKMARMAKRIRILMIERRERNDTCFRVNWRTWLCDDVGTHLRLRKS